jgi:hypothetical protein
VGEVDDVARLRLDDDDVCLEVECDDDDDDEEADEGCGACRDDEDGVSAVFLADDRRCPLEEESIC